MKERIHKLLWLFYIQRSTGFIVESPLSLPYFKSADFSFGNGQFVKRKGPGNNRVKGHLVSGLVPLHMLNQVRWFGVHFESVQRFQTCFFESLEIVLILCFLIASQDILRFHTNYNGTISLSNRSLLKCEATLSGRDIQSEMETQTSCEAQTLALECSQHRPRLLLKLFDTQDLAEKSRW